MREKIVSKDGVLTKAVMETFASLKQTKLKRVLGAMFGIGPEVGDVEEGRRHRRKRNGCRNGTRSGRHVKPRMVDSMDLKYGRFGGNTPRKGVSESTVVRKAFEIGFRSGSL